MHLLLPHAEAHSALHSCVHPSFPGRPSFLSLDPSSWTLNLQVLSVFGSLKTHILRYLAIRITYPHIRPTINVLCWWRVLWMMFWSPVFGLRILCSMWEAGFLFSASAPVSLAGFCDSVPAVAAVKACHYAYRRCAHMRGNLLTLARPIGESCKV